MPKLPLVRGDVVFVDLAGADGNEKHGRRPCVVVGNDGGNRVSPLTIVALSTETSESTTRQASGAISATRSWDVWTTHSEQVLAYR